MAAAAAASGLPSVTKLHTDDQNIMKDLFLYMVRWFDAHIMPLTCTEAERVDRRRLVTSLYQSTLLCAQPSNITKTDADGNCFLHELARAGCTALLVHVLRYDEILTRINARNKNGDTPLHCVLRSALRTQAPPEFSPLLCAAKILIWRGARLDLPNTEGLTPADLIFVHPGMPLNELSDEQRACIHNFTKRDKLPHKSCIEWKPELLDVAYSLLFGRQPRQQVP